MKKLIVRRSLLLSFAWALVIFLLCATPGQFIPSANWLDLLSFDKFVHASMFFVLCSLGFINAAKHSKTTATFVFIFFICVLYGGSLEIMQAKVFTNRSADWLDFIANSFGCVIAALLLSKTKNYFLA